MTTAHAKGHNAPCSNHDFDFFYRALEEKRLAVQRCCTCGALRGLPSPGCGECGSLDWQEQTLSGEGIVFSYVIHYHPPLPGFASPHPVVLVDMDEDVRMIGAMDGIPVDQVAIGQKVKVAFLRRDDVAAFRFVAA